MQQVLEGLDYAHKRGVVHRDIKPGNIMINKEGQAKIADFGLAHLAAAQGGLDVTRENQSMGTLKYMAPEQLTSAKNVDGPRRPLQPGRVPLRNVDRLPAPGHVQNAHRNRRQSRRPMGRRDPPGASHGP